MQNNENSRDILLLMLYKMWLNCTEMAYMYINDIINDITDEISSRYIGKAVHHRSLTNRSEGIIDYF